MLLIDPENAEFAWLKSHVAKSVFAEHPELRMIDTRNAERLLRVRQGRHAQGKTSVDKGDDDSPDSEYSAQERPRFSM